MTRDASTPRYCRVYGLKHQPNYRGHVPLSRVLVCHLSFQEVTYTWVGAHLRVRPRQTRRSAPTDVPIPPVRKRIRITAAFSLVRLPLPQQAMQA
jgi:hypothetical protein